MFILFPYLGRYATPIEFNILNIICAYRKIKIKIPKRNSRTTRNSEAILSEESGEKARNVFHNVALLDMADFLMFLNLIVVAAG